MKNFVKINMINIEIELGNPKKNTQKIIDALKKESDKNIDFYIFQHLSLTGVTCASLLRQKELLKDCIENLDKIREFSQSISGVIVVGLPLSYYDKVFSVAAVINNGIVECLIPLTPPNEFLDDFNYENTIYFYNDEAIPFGHYVINSNLTRFAITGGQTNNTIKSIYYYGINGACIIFALTSDKTLIDSMETNIYSALSSFQNLAIARLNCGIGESVDKDIFLREKAAFECGEIINKTSETNSLIFDFDIDYIEYKRRIFKNESCFDNFIEIEQEEHEDKLIRKFNPIPFWNPNQYNKIFEIITTGIKARFDKTHSKNLIFGLSGGLDSTMVLISCLKFCEKYNIAKSKIIAVTMSGLGSTERTQSNAKKILNLLEYTHINIPINNAVLNHLKDIQHENIIDVTYENAQARERAQILLDLANKNNALLLGTGDLSEIALGFSTYGGDQLAHFNPNSGLTKTHIKEILKYYINNDCQNDEIKKILQDIINTPISPELKQDQKTENILGSYEVNDFILYHMILRGGNTEKIKKLLKCTFNNLTDSNIKQYIENFKKRFYANRFKHNFSCSGIQLLHLDINKNDYVTDYPTFN